MERRGTIWGAGALLLAVGLAVRFWHVFAEPLWLDEAYSAYAAAHGFDFIWRVVPRYEAHPPFYYTVLKCWTLAFGDGLVPLRALGLLASLATMPLVTTAAWQMGAMLGWQRRRRGQLMLAAFALACLSPALVEMARQVRPYPLMILTYAGACLVLVRLAMRGGAGRPLAGRTYFAYLAIVEAMLWLHDLGPLYAAAMGLALLAAVIRPGLGRAGWAWLIGGHLGVILLYLPAFAMMRDQAGVWEHSTWLRFGLGVLPGKLAGLYAVPDWPVMAAVLLAMLAMAMLSGTGEGRRLLAMLLLLGIVPVLLAVLISMAVVPVFLPRVLAAAAVPALLLFAIGATAGGRARWPALAGAVVLAVNMLAVDIQARAAGPMQDWYRTVAWLHDHVRPGDVIFAYPNEGALPLARALHDKGLDYPIRAIPTPVPAEDPAATHPTGYRGVASLPGWRLHQIAAEPATQAVPTIWLLRLGASAYDPGDLFLKELHHGRYIVRSWLDGPIDIVGLRRRDLDRPAPIRSHASPDAR